MEVVSLEHCLGCKLGFKQQSGGLSFVYFSQIIHLPCGIYKNGLCCVLRLLAREGINAEQLTRDLKSFELKVSIIFHIFIYANSAFVASNSRTL